MKFKVTVYEYFSPDLLGRFWSETFATLSALELYLEKMSFATIVKVVIEPIN